MKRRLISFTALIAFTLLVFFSGCGDGVKSELVGTWKATDVVADVDTASISQDALAAVLENYRSVHFEFYENNSMSIVSSGNVYSGRWEFDKADKMVNVRFDKSNLEEFSPLGKLEDGRITNVNNTGIGVITVIYEKAESQD